MKLLALCLRITACQGSQIGRGYCKSAASGQAVDQWRRLMSAVMFPSKVSGLRLCSGRRSLLWKLSQGWNCDPQHRSVAAPGAAGPRKNPADNPAAAPRRHNRPRHHVGALFRWPPHPAPNRYTHPLGIAHSCRPETCLGSILCIHFVLAWHDISGASYQLLRS